MAQWVLIPALDCLFDEFDRIAPNRDHTTDGSIGDDAHSQRSSDHNPDETGATPDEDSDTKNEVHAIDVDRNLNVEGFDMEDCVQHILWRCRKSNSDPENEPRLKYIIYKERIWEAPDWEEEDYDGDNPHNEHAHFSAEYDSEYSEDRSPWGLIEKFGDDVNKSDFMAWMTEWSKSADGKRAFWSANHEDTVPMTDAETGELLPDAGADSRMAPDTALKTINQNAINIKNTQAELNDKLDQLLCQTETTEEV